LQVAPKYMNWKETRSYLRSGRYGAQIFG